MLRAYEVGVRTGVGYLAGVPARNVSREITSFIEELKRKLAGADSRFPLGAELGDSDEFVVLELAAWAHGEWVRIHPFANGNGRTARLWGVFVCARYGLEAFLSARPRPQHTDFPAAAAASMAGDHFPMALVFVDLLNAVRSEPS
ncbi:Fic family protein [Humibacillus xanthopallidus]|uniref:Fic family protein n=1 Tax=Humibacillus xanthopallidus TaxID=412689 RepID=UPI001150DDED